MRLPLTYDFRSNIWPAIVAYRVVSDLLTAKRHRRSMMRHASKPSMLLGPMAHAAAVLAGLASLHLAPPLSGNVLLVPLTGAARRQLPALALDGRALLLRQGPWTGSMVVRTREELRFGALLGAAILPMAAPGWMCGRDTRRR